MTHDLPYVPGGFKRSMQHFTEEGEVDAQEEEERAGSARLHRGSA